MDWKIAEAKQKFSEVVRQTAAEPQRIYKRDRLVAVIVDVDDYEAYEAWREEKERPSMAEAIEEIRKICLEEDFDLELPERRDRPNAFAEALDDLSV